MASPAPDAYSAPTAPGTPQGAIVGPVTAHIAFVVELTLVPLLLPAIQAQLGLTLPELAWVFNSYAIAIAFGVLLGGWWGDIFETRKIFGLGLGFFAIGSGLVAVASTFEILALGRALQGFGGGIFAPLVAILLTRAAPKTPGRMLIFWGSIAGYIAALVPLVYGRFLGEYDWHLAFVFIALVAGTALIFLGTSPRADKVVETRPRLIDVADLFKERDLLLAYAYVFLSYGSITYYLFRLPVWLSSHEYGAAAIGLILSVLWLTFSALSTLLRNMVDKPYLRTIMLAAPSLIACGLPLAYYSESIVFLVISSALVGAGLACSNAPSTQAILKFAPAALRGLASSMDITFARIGGIATVALLANTRFAYGALAVALSCLVAVFCAQSLSKRLVEDV